MLTFKELRVPGYERVSSFSNATANLHGVRIPVKMISGSRGSRSRIPRDRDHAQRGIWGC